LQEWADTITARHSVNPYVLIGLLVACAPFFYFSIYKLIRSLAKKQSKNILVWSSVFLAATALPWLYVLAFGKNLPWYIYLVLGALLAQSIYSLIRKLVKKPAAGGKPDSG
jgi:hypothetical protein